MSFIDDLLDDMAADSPSPPSSRESSPVDYDDVTAPPSPPFEHVSEAEAQNSAFLHLPVDIFRCVADYLDRDAAAHLKRSCRGMSRSKVVDELLFRYPIQHQEARDIRLAEWKYRHSGQARWLAFKRSVTDANRHYVQKISMSHWHSIADFEWIQNNLPNLTSLDIVGIKDFVWTPEETWTWKMLADACPELFARLDELEVSNWADYNAQSRIEYNYSYKDYRFKPKFRMSRRRDGGSVAKMIFPLCVRLKSLTIREGYTGFHTWNEWEVHQRVCSLVDNIVKNCPPTLKKLRVYDYATYRALFSTDITSWPNLTDLEIGLYQWMEDRPDRDIIGPVPYRITPGHHHRDDEEAFDDKSFDTCERNHIDLGQHVVQGVTGTFEDLLQNLRTITKKFPSFRIRPVDTRKETILLPFHLVNVSQRHSRATLFAHHNQQQPNATTVPQDAVANPDVQEALKFLSTTCAWQPVLSWDNMMCDVFPANLEPMRTPLPKADVVGRIEKMVSTLKNLKIPVKLMIGEGTPSCPSSGMDGCLFFGDYKCFVGEDENKTELLAPTQARFNLGGVASMVDELTIKYPFDCPGVSGFWGRGSKRPSEAEKELLRKEMKGWRKFWLRYASLLKNLKKLTVAVPNDIYNDWGKSQPLCALLADDVWDVYEPDNTEGLDTGTLQHPMFGFGPRKYRKTFHGLNSKMRFTHKVFFRENKEQLALPPAAWQETDHEAPEITEEMIATVKDRAAHKFWPAKVPKAERTKRKVEESGEEALLVKRQRFEQD